MIARQCAGSSAICRLATTMAQPTRVAFGIDHVKCRVMRKDNAQNEQADGVLDATDGVHEAGDLVAARAACRQSGLNGRYRGLGEPEQAGGCAAQYWASPPL